MKNRLAVLVLSSVVSAVTPLAAQSYTGSLDTPSCAAITGYAWDANQPNTPITVDIYDLSIPIATVTANLYRSNPLFGNGDHGFSLAVPPYLKDGQTHTLTAYFGGTKITLLYASQPLNCPAGSTGYVYYYNDPLTSIISGNWTQNGSATATTGGLTATSSSGGSLISTVAVPDGTSDYEVKTTLALTASGGTYVSYLRASSNAKSGPGATGSFYSLEVTPAFSGPTCYLTMALNKTISGVITQLVTGQVYCHSGTTVRFAIIGSVIVVTTDNHVWWEYADSSIPTGKPGVGAFGTPAGNSISAVSFGPADRIAPQSPNPATFATSVLPTRLDLAFSGVLDDPNGTGVAVYWFYRDGVWLGGSVTPEFSDQTLSPGTSHTYSIYAIDYHWNLSAASSFNITTPPANSVDPRRIGIRPTGTYWGGPEEQIDVLSGNVNFTLPLLRAQARGGWSVPFALTYNSQNWRKDSGGTWNLGEDVGYGYGWKLLAGSLTPYYYGSWAVDHYVFTDSTGAQYRLDQNSGGVWTSRESLYVWYNANNSHLYFRDGSFWVMGCTSGGSEPDAGTMYPTTMENTNGNQILVYYFAGSNLTWTNSSARIQYIQDVRAVNHTNGTETYTFIYNTDLIPHLTSIQNAIGTSEGYQFTYWPTATLLDPFSNSTFSYPGGFNGLHTVMVLGITAQHYFYYDSSGEMIETVLPYLGYYKWVYGSVTYSSGFTQREVFSRYMSKDGNINTEVAYPFTHESSTGVVHQFTKLNDPGGVGQKYWTFSTSGANIGLLTQYQGVQLPSTTLTQNDFTWTQDANSNFYIGSTLNTFYPGPAQSKTDQTVDIYGNVTQVKKYNFGSLTTPARTYTYSYLNSSAYTSSYIFNRLTLATVTDGTNNVTLASNSYDAGNYSPVSPTPQEWDTAYANVLYRGNVSVSTTPSGTNYYYYDQAGNVKSAIVNGVTTTVTNDSTNNYGAPTAITTGSLMNTLAYAAFLGLTNDTGPNGASTSTLYDTYARPSQTTSPFGAITTYAYSLNPPMVTATINNGRWTRQTLDGFGRTIKTEAGDASGTQSVSESVYGPCACSPIGKLMQQSMAHAPNATSITWTTYTYDGVGRTLSVATVGSDTQGTSSYAYAFSMYDQWITAWDPSGNYKYFVTDAFNNLVTVSESAGGTYYAYDLLDHLTTVSMPRSNGTQIRTFVYSGNFLTSATNPENGTATYTYNNYNKVATKTDAKGQQIVYTYDALARLTKVQRYPSANNEDVCQQENYSYDTNPYDSNYSQYSSGRLTAVQYYGGSTTYGSGYGPFCDTTFTEMYTYNQAGAKLGKRLRVTRNLAKGDPRNPNGWTYAPYNADLNSVYTYDNEGKMLTVNYPAYGQSNGTAGPNLGYAYDTMGRLNTITDLVANSSVISSATYGPAGELLTMFGQANESRTYNSMRQLTQLYAGSGYPWPVNVAYAYPAIRNNGKIASQTDGVTGEQVVYTYDAMNRLASATATNNSWGQSYAYDGFGNLTDQTVTVGTAPSYHVTYNPANNRNNGDSSDANGNLTTPINYNNNYNTPNYDVENRLATLGYQVVQYSYAAGNKRVWRGVWTLNQQTLQNTLTTDEVTFWGVTGQKLATYQLSVVGGVINYSNTTPQLVATQTATNYYFGGKLIKNASGYVGADRLGSIGKFYPWGQEKPSATTNGTEKFTGYFRDAETGLDYADQRYHSPGTGRFMTPDRYVISRLTDPGSWNKYGYTRGDPVNKIDPGGACDQSADTSTSVTVCGTPDPAMPYVFALGYTPDIEFDQNIENQMSSTVGASLQLAFAPFATSVTQVTQAKNSLNDELNNLGPNCQKILPTMSTLKSDAGDLSFWDARLFGSMPIGFLPGAVGSPKYQTIGSAVVNSNAAILYGSNGTISNYVVLGTGFFNQNPATQGITLLHELLHYALQLNDQQIVDTYGISLQAGDTASSAFQQWLQNDCKNKSN